MRVSSPDVTLAPGWSNSIGYVGFVLSFGSFVGGFMYNDSSIDIDVFVQAMCVPGGASGTTAVTGAEADRAFAQAAARQQEQIEE